MNTTKKLFLLIILFSFKLCFGQNENESREAFTLKLAVDTVRFYQQEIKNSKYFVKDNILQIYSGENLFIETELTDNIITSMKVVKKNINPSKTIEINFSQTVSGKENKGMMLQVSNPFNKSLSYDAMMFIVGKNEWIKTSILPIKPKLKNVELWNDVIITLVLNNWRLEK